MSTSVIRPGASAKQQPSGKTFGMLIAGLTAVVVLGFVFYSNQSQDVGAGGVQSNVGQLTDTWLVNQQAAQKAALDQSATYETERLMAAAERYAATSAAPTAAQMIEESIESVVAGRTQAQIEAQGESFTINQVAGTGVSPAFGHEFEPEVGAGSNGNTVRVPAR